VGHKSPELVAKLCEFIIPKQRGILGLDLLLDDCGIAQEPPTIGRERHSCSPTIAGIDRPSHVAYPLEIVHQPAHSLLAHAGPIGKIDNVRAVDVEIDKQRCVCQGQGRVSSGLQHGHGSRVEASVESQAQPSDVLLS
jgi:hypothetical protein